MVNIEDMSVESIEKHLERIKEDKRTLNYSDGFGYIFRVEENGSLFIEKSIRCNTRGEVYDSIYSLRDAVKEACKRRGIKW